MQASRDRNDLEHVQSTYSSCSRPLSRNLWLTEDKPGAEKVQALSERCNGGCGRVPFLYTLLVGASHSNVPRKTCFDTLCNVKSAFLSNYNNQNSTVSNRTVHQGSVHAVQQGVLGSSFFTTRTMCGKIGRAHC